jgi:glycine betaine/proline transport system ATP-binding protein
MTQSAKIICRNIWKVFGPQPQQVIDQAQGSAASAADALSKADALATTGHVVAVRDVSFTIAAGETFVVMGLSGSGKSTLLRCLPRLIAPSRGQVLIDGEDVATMPEQQLRQLRRHKLSMVFQHFGLFPHRTILDNVAYGLEVQGVKRAKRYAQAQRVLELVNLTGWDQHYPAELSGGMQQRVGLARALAVDPEILLFDEPFSALDPLIRREMQDELLSLQQQMHKTIIFITHDFAEAIKLADAHRTIPDGKPETDRPTGGRIAIMKDGAFVQVGSPEEIVLHPINDYVADFAKDVPRAAVLTAQAIMQPVPAAAELGNHPIAGALKLDTLISLFVDTDATLPVVDEQGAIIGSLDRRTVMLALSNNGVAL